MREIILTQYMKYRAQQRNYDLDRLNEIVLYSTEKYFDTETARTVIIGTHRDKLVLVPCEENELTITPITVHATTRQQIKFRINTGRFKHL